MRCDGGRAGFAGVDNLLFAAAVVCRTVRVIWHDGPQHLRYESSFQLLVTTAATRTLSSPPLLLSPSLRQVAPACHRAHERTPLSSVWMGDVVLRRHVRLINYVHTTQDAFRRFYVTYR